MVSVDPERDTLDSLAKYVTAFDPRFVGLRGDLEATRKVAQEFKIYFEKRKQGDTYTVDHSAQSYVIDPQGRLRLLVRHDRIAQDLAHDLRMLLRGYRRCSCARRRSLAARAIAGATLAAAVHGEDRVALRRGKFLGHAEPHHLRHAVAVERRREVAGPLPELRAALAGVGDWKGLRTTRMLSLTAPPASGCPSA